MHNLFIFCHKTGSVQKRKGHVHLLQLLVTCDQILIFTKIILYKFSRFGGTCTIDYYFRFAQTDFCMRFSVDFDSCAKFLWLVDIHFEYFYRSAVNGMLALNRLGHHHSFSIRYAPDHGDIRLLHWLDHSIIPRRMHFLPPMHCTVLILQRQDSSRQPHLSGILAVICVEALPLLGPFDILPPVYLSSSWNNEQFSYIFDMLRHILCSHKMYSRHF